MSWGVAEGSNKEESAATLMVTQHDSLLNSWNLKHFILLMISCESLQLFFFDSCDLSRFIFFSLLVDESNENAKKSGNKPQTAADIHRILRKISEFP